MMERKVHSQNGEDGITQQILEKIGVKHKTCVEIGVDYVGSNTLLLAEMGWKTWMFDADPVNAATMKAVHAPLKNLTVTQARLTKTNINETFKIMGIPEEVDFLSIDVDGLDWHLWKALTYTRPRILCIEYNADYGRKDAYVVAYREDFDRHLFHPRYYGASLKALEALGYLKGMKLVCCDSSGNNAFFVEQHAPLEPVHSEEAWYPNKRRTKMTSEMLSNFRRKFGFEEVRVNWIN